MQRVGNTYTISWRSRRTAARPDSGSEIVLRRLDLGTGGTKPASVLGAAALSRSRTGPGSSTAEHIASWTFGLAAGAVAACAFAKESREPCRWRLQGTSVLQFREKAHKIAIQVTQMRVRASPRAASSRHVTFPEGVLRNTVPRSIGHGRCDAVTHAGSTESYLQSRR